MRRLWKPARLALPVVLGLLLLTGTALADAGFELTWSTVDSCGGSSTGGGYELSGTIGQPDAGALTGTTYVLAGGFWGGAPVKLSVYLPMLFRGQ